MTNRESEVAATPLYKAEIMEEEYDFSLEETNIKNNKIQERITNLSQKVELTAKERDELAAAKQAIEAEREAALKERDFYKNFNQQAAKYPGAIEYQDQILEKVKAGYSEEDATIAVLAKEGKFTPPAPKVEEQAPIAGGSATTTVQGPKPTSDMSQEERRAKLAEALGS